MKLNIGPFARSVSPTKPMSMKPGGMKSSLGVMTDMKKKNKKGSNLSKFAQTLMNLHSKGGFRSKIA